MKPNPITVIDTNYGKITLEIFSDKTPRMAENFLTLAEQGKYDNTIFHRVIKDFMIQGGDYENHNGTGGSSFTGNDLKDEFVPELKNIKGAISMANRGPHTNGSQFFIIHAETTPWLDGKHSVFGKVIEGMDIIDTIANVETNSMDAPTEEVKVLSIKVKK